MGWDGGTYSNVEGGKGALLSKFIEWQSGMDEWRTKDGPMAAELLNGDPHSPIGHGRMRIRNKMGEKANGLKRGNRRNSLEQKVINGKSLKTNKMKNYISELFSNWELEQLM